MKIAPSLRFVSVILAAALGAACVAELEPVDSASAEVGGRPTFALEQDTEGRYGFQLIAATDEVMLTNEGYTQRVGALGGIVSVLDNGAYRERYRVFETDEGAYYFALRAGNGRLVGTSELYADRAGADAGIAASIRAVADYLEHKHNRTGARFDIFAGKDGRFYFNLRAKNGSIVLQSQGYSSEAAAWNGTFSVAAHGVDPSRYDLRQAKNGGHYFNLTASNGQVVATSQVYSTRSNAVRARDAIVALLPIVDLL